MRERLVGISSYALPHSVASGRVDCFRLLELTHELGVEVVQLCENIGWHPDLFEAAGEYGLVVEFGTSDLSNHAQIDRCIDFAEESGTGFFRLVIDGPNYHPDTDEIIEDCKRILNQTRLKIGIENHDRFRANELIRIVEAIGTDRAGIVLDTANSLGCFESPEETLRLLGPYSIGLHWKPVKIDRISSKLGFDVRGCPSSESPLPLKKWIDCTQGNIILEQWTPDGFTYEQELEWLKASLSHVRANYL